MKHRINLKNWRVADVDNYMNGNPFFSDFMEESDWTKDVNKVFGNYDFKEISNRKDMNDLKPMVDVYRELLETREPKSNWDMPSIKAAEAAAAAAELKAKQEQEAAEKAA